MPNHVHMIVQIVEEQDKGTVPRARTEKFGVPTRKSIPTVVRYLKGGVTRMYNKAHNCNMPIWQRNYYEHIIRNEKEYHQTCEYIKQNPFKWIKSNP